MPKMIPCFSCGAECPDIQGPVHDYMLSSPGCWAAYGNILAREYSDVNYFRVHQLTVDAYACQHPGKLQKQSIQSVGIHLSALYLHFEKGVKLSEMTARRQQMSVSNKDLGLFNWLEPPSNLGEITVNDVLEAEDSKQHYEKVTAWALSVWEAWEDHKLQVKKWVDLLST